MLEQKMAHSWHPVLRWMMDNIFIKTDFSGNINTNKKAAEQIDGSVATTMALDCAIIATRIIARAFITK